MRSKVFAVIDTNVIVSALISKNPESYPLLVLAHVYSGTINAEIIQEYREVLSRDKFHLNPLDIEDALRVIQDYGLNVERTEVKDEVFPDTNDIVFYEVKMSKEDAYLVTGNIKHFPKKPFVVTPREMVEIIDEL